MALSWRVHDAGRNARTPNSWGLKAGLGWSSCLETGGRWSDEAVRLLARAKVRSEPRILKKRFEQAWRFRWLSMLRCAAVRSLAASLLELRSSGSVDGPTPLSHDNHRCSFLDLSCARFLFWLLWVFVLTEQTIFLPSLGKNDVRMDRACFSASRGAAREPSGMSVEHLQPLPDMPRALRAFFQTVETAGPWHCCW